MDGRSDSGGQRTKVKVISKFWDVQDAILCIALVIPTQCIAEVIITMLLWFNLSVMP